MISQIFFIVITFLAGYLAFKGYSRIWNMIKLGTPMNFVGDKRIQWRNMILFALGQRKMFKRWIPAIFHFFIYAAFIVTQIELLEIFFDGILGTHRMFAPYLGGFYVFIIGFIEVLSLLAFIATVIFLWRRNILKLPRFKSNKMKGWPSMDANLILLGELLLIVGIFSMNGADHILQNLEPEHYLNIESFAISGWLGPMLFSGFDTSALIGIERFGWWLHYLVVLGFLVYIPYSKHLHIFLAFPNSYYTSQRPRGEIENMETITNEIKSMMGLLEENSQSMEEELPDFGANDIFNLSSKTLLDAFTCTECGRCTSVCPANITGKALSPRKVMMDIRDRTEEVYYKISNGSQEATKYNDEKSLFDLITPEEIHACTTCMACIEACPVLINPLVPILQLRRYEILTLSEGPKDWIPMFTSIENSGSVWQVTEDREHWSSSKEE